MANLRDTSITGNLEVSGEIKQGDNKVLDTSGGTVTGDLYVNKGITVKAGVGVRLNSKDNTQFMLYGDGSTQTIYTQVKKSDGSYGYGKLMDTDTKLYSQNKEVATTTDLENYLPLTAGSDKPLTDILYANKGIRIPSDSAIRFAGEAKFITPSKVIRFGSSDAYNSDLLVMTQSYLRPNGNNTTLGNTSNQWKEIYGVNIYQNGKQVANKEDVPTSYIKDANINDDILIITKQDGEEIEFEGGGAKVIVRRWY